MAAATARTAPDAANPMMGVALSAEGPAAAAAAPMPRKAGGVAGFATGVTKEVER
jgi:hypothetical protein